ncbi:MAG TPA: energy transducer TonB, partial [Blastocatellia bacterium]|nr:energy transducer TonB [Blastocatellia bacterium]
LDADLPNTPFRAWFSQLVGPEAVVVWQLTECGEHEDRPATTDQDQTACAEASAALPDGRQLIVAISVGTFKTGISDRPAFYTAFIRQNKQLYLIQRLRDLVKLWHSPDTLPGQLSDVTASLTRMGSPSGVTPLSLRSLSKSPSAPEIASEVTGPPPAAPEPAPAATTPEPTPTPEPSATGTAALPNVPKTEEPPEPPAPQEPQKIQEGVLQGLALVKVKPVYPANARSMNAFGSVEVQILVSEDGHVLSAKAVSGHPVLRGPAVEAARKWVFTPTTLNGIAVKVDSVLTFVFR